MGPCKSKIKKQNKNVYDTLAISFLILDFKDGKSIDECYLIIKDKSKISKNKFKKICNRDVIPNKEKSFSNDELIRIHNKIFI